MQNKYLNPDVWGPHYWFVFHTIAMTYPLNPNDTIKKKYYDTIQNIPLFIPDENMGNKFIKLLNKYPVTPYLDSRMSLMKWFHFIHNKVNKLLNKPIISFKESLENYHKNYIPREVRETENNKNKKTLIYGLICIILFTGGYILWKQTED